MKALFTTLLVFLIFYTSNAQTLDDYRRIKNDLERKINLYQDSLKQLNSNIEQIVIDQNLKQPGRLNIDAKTSSLHLLKEEPTIFGKRIIKKNESPKDYPVKIVDYQYDGSDIYWKLSVKVNNDLLIYLEDNKSELTGYLRATYVKGDDLKILEQKLFEDSEQQYQDEKNKIALEKEKQEEQRQNKIYNNRLAQFTAKYGKTNGEKVAKGLIWIDMTDKMARDSWGPPKDINKSVGSWGVREQWVYGDGQYLYFKNGKLTSWQQ